MIKLPHELLGPECAHLLPLSVKGERLTSYRLTYDPDLQHQDKDVKKGKNVLKEDLPTACRDPRDRNARRNKARKELRLLSFRWDQHSTRPKPPPPAHSIVISGLSTLMTVAQIRQLIRPYGRINNVELKHDPGTGASTGVCFLSFAQDYDDDLKLVSGMEQSKAQRGDLIAKDACAKIDGQRFGSEIVKVLLDDAQGTKYRQTYRDLLARKAEAMKQAMRIEKEQKEQRERASASAAVAESARATSSKLVTSSAMRPPDRPRGPKSMMGTIKSSTNGYHDDASPVVSPYSRHSSSTGSQFNGDAHARTSSRSSIYDDERHASTERSDRREQHSRASHSLPSPERYLNRPDKRTTSDREVMRSTLEFLARNNRPYVFVPRIRTSNITSDAITLLFVHHRPERIKSVDAGWYVAFRGREDAHRAKNVLHGTTVSGYRITVEVHEAEEATQALSRQSVREQQDDRHASTHREEEVEDKIHWKDDSDLLKDSELLFKYELGLSFMRDLLSRVVNKHTTEFLRPEKPAGKLLQEASTKQLDDIDDMEIDIDLDAERPKTFNRAAREEQRQRMLAQQREAERRERGPYFAASEDEDEDFELKDQKVTATQSVKTAKVKKAAKAKQLAGIDTGDVKAARKKVQRAPSPPVDPFLSGLADEEEDLYFCRMALEALQRGETANDIPDDNWQPEDESGLPPHQSGCARTEGFYRIPPAEKGRHLADRNLGSDEIVIAPSSIVGLASARDNRADSRRFVQGIEQHKKETATDTDILKFNQLRSRKKQLKFAKSPIHDWGLYAMEAIPTGDMVIEYVGEIVRQQVADEREKTYERQGNFSTYLFRVDDDIVVDATKKGNIARLMNHCCTPNCNAKILTLNGEKRIVLYAKQIILPGQELTYDYKFQATGDEEDAIACLCGSSGCRGFL